MGDWLFALPLLWMTLVIFAAAYLVAAGVCLVVVGLAVNDRGRAFKAFSPQMLTPLGVVFGLLVGFVALQTWNDFDKAKVAVATEASARRQRIIISQSEVGPVKWAAILLMGLCTLIAIAVVHSDNRLACAMAVTLFATGIALSSLLIAACSRPFTGEISVKPELLQQVIPSEMATVQPNGH